jgi:tRNA pseudouridine32 synthase/23S rRNA pseudouridine746 synthase
MDCLHPLDSSITPPERFTYPFCYEPHALCRAAAARVQEYIKEHASIREDADRGKMFGVLIVEPQYNPQQDETSLNAQRSSLNLNTFFLAAYSGLLAGRNDWPWFVPPVVDAQQPDGVFKTREAEISAINKQIEEIENDKETQRLRHELARCREVERLEVDRFKAMMEKSKKIRDLRRMQRNIEPTVAAELIRESQFQKAELRRLQKSHGEKVARAEEALRGIEERIETLRNRRREMSDALQRWLFSQYRMLNVRGEEKDLLDIFQDFRGTLPPAAAGDCCAPKLLQYAYQHHLRPLCMAEFWWGESPQAEIRHHLEYYPSCRSRCLPILTWMMQGLDVDPNPQEMAESQPLPIVYEDKDIWVVDKPAGMLSVPGKIKRESVCDILKARCAEGEEPLVIHRLDMETSGLLVVAKNGVVQRWLQRQFEERKVEKRYVALVEGSVAKGGEVIDLPLRANPLDRPRQVVDREKGREALTRYEVLDSENGITRLALYPVTGRTHQLRVHCAHAEGLAAPIVGDRLYGHPATRLMLHCQQVRFLMPDGTPKHFASECPF